MRFDANVAASGTISAPFGSFDNLTVSGQPVSTGTGGGAGLDPAQDQDITGNWDFQAGLTKSGVTVATQDDLSQVTTSGFASVVSGTIIRPLGTAHNPLGLWTFDGDLTDSSGNGNTLTVEVGGGDIVRIGPYLSGYSFHNQTILIAADDSAFKITGDVTWQAIVIYAADTVVAATKTIAGQAGPSGDGDDTENFLYRMAINTTESLQYFAESAGGNNIAFSVTEKLNGRARRLQHVAFVRENDQITAYVDGIRYNTSSGLNPPAGGSATRFRIGGDISSGAGDNFFTGIITSVKVNAGALTSDQIRREYESTLAIAIIPEEFTTVSGAFTQSLTVSGVPVDITGGGGGGSSLTVKEVDGVPSVSDVDTIVVTNGTLTDDGGGTVSIVTCGGSGAVSGDFSGAQIVISGANQTIANITNTVLAYDRAEYDTDNYFIASSGVVLTVPSGKGISHVVLKAQVVWVAVAGSDTYRDIIFNRDYARIDANSEVRETAPANNTFIHQAVSAAIPVEDGDEFSVVVRQNTGGDLDVADALQRTWFSIEDVTPKSTTITVQEQDGDPTVSGVSTIKVTNGTLTDEGGGVISIDTGGSGGGGIPTTASGGYWSTDAPPTYPSPFDDEFDTFTDNPTGTGSLDNVSDEWTQFNPGGNLQLPLKFGDGVSEMGLGFSNLGNATPTWNGFVRPLAPMAATASGGQNYWFETKIALGERDGITGLGGIFIGGDLINNPTTEEFLYIALVNNHATIAGETVIRHVTNGVLYNSVIGTNSSVTVKSGPNQTSIYLRIVYDGAANGYASMYSTDGLAWSYPQTSLIASGTLNFTPQTVGLIGRAEDLFGGLQTNFPFFRFRLDDDRNAGVGRITVSNFPLNGRRIYTNPVAAIPSALEAASGAFSESLTVSGIPVSIGVGNFSGALVVLSGSDQSITNFVTTYIDFDHVEYDTDGYTTSSGQVLQIPEGLGITHVIVKAGVSWAGDVDDDTSRGVIIRKDYSRMYPSVEFQENASPNLIIEQNGVSYPIPVTGGEQFMISVFQNSSNTIDLKSAAGQTWMSIEVVAPR